MTVPLPSGSVHSTPLLSSPLCLLCQESLQITLVRPGPGLADSDQRAPQCGVNKLTVICGVRSRRSFFIDKV